MHEPVTYYAYDKVWLALNVTNRGKSDLTIESVKIGDCVLTPIRVPVIISAGGETVTYIFSGEWLSGAPAAALHVEATGRVATRQRVLRTLPGHIDVQQVPSLDLALIGIPSGDAVEVGPSAGYGVTLGCRSTEGGTGAIEKLRVTIFRGGTQNEIASTDVLLSPAVSIGPGKSAEIPVLLPHHSPAGELLKGTHYCEIAPILRDGGLDLLNGKLTGIARTACSFQVTYRERAEVTVGVGRPTEAGYGVVAFVRGDLTARYTDLIDSRFVAGTILQNDPLVNQTFKDLAEGAFSWRIPIGEERIKELFLLPLARAGAAAEVESHLTATVRFAGNADDVEIRMRQAPEPDEPEPAWQPWSQEILFDRFILARQLQVYVVARRPGRHEITLQIRVRDASSAAGWELSEYRVTIHAFEPALYRQVVGLDFGTSNSCVALDAGEFRADGKWIFSGTPRCLPLNVFDRHGSLDPSVVPSLLGYRRKIENGGVVPFLPDPRNLPHHVCVEFKIALQDAQLFEHEEFRVDSLQQTIDYLKLLIIRAREYLEERGIRESRLGQTVVVTLPTTFIEIGRERILDAVRTAVPGLASQALLPCDESIAALLFARRTETDLFLNQRVIVVYDFGGGTTDVTSLWVDAPADLFEIGIGGSSDVGGSVIDRWMLQRLTQSAVPSLHALPELSRRIVLPIPEVIGSGAARVSLENLKKRFGDLGLLSEGVREVSSSYSIDESWLTVEGEDLGALLAEPLHEALEKKFAAILDDILSRSLSYEDLREPRNLSLLVILAGNGSRLARLPESIQGILENNLQQRRLDGTVDVLTLSQPKEAVALGAASYSGTLVPERRAERLRFFVRLDAQSVFVATDLEPTRRMSPSELGLSPNRVPDSLSVEERQGIDTHSRGLIPVTNHPGRHAPIQWLDFDVRGNVKIDAVS